MGRPSVILLLTKPMLGSYTLEDHHAAAKKAALEGIVLMKNEGGLLPLKPGVQAAVIGDFAKTPRIQGAGSSLVNPTRVDTPLSCCEKAGIKIAGFAQGFRRDSLYVGYRYFDTVKKKVCFPFGHGLCYTDFDYKELIVEEKGVSFTLTNVGERAGAEVAQLYVRRRSEEVFRPEKELKGFVRVELQPGESKRVTIPFDDKTFRYFNVKTGAFEREAGEMGWNSPMSYMAQCKNPLCRLVGKFLSYKVKHAKKPNLNLLCIYGMPIRSIPKLMVGMVNMEMAEGILTAANGHFFKGLGRLVKGFFQGRRQLKTLRKDA